VSLASDHLNHDHDCINSQYLGIEEKIRRLKWAIFSWSLELWSGPRWLLSSWIIQSYGRIFIKREAERWLVEIDD